MKTFLLCLLAAIAFAAQSFATPTPTPHNAAVINGTIYTQMLTGTSSAVLKAQKIDNATILAKLVTTGTYTGLAAKDLAIVFKDADLEVINKTTLAPVYELATTGPDSTTTSSITYGNAAKFFFITETLTDYEFSLPGSATEQTSLYLHAKLKPDFSRILNVHFTFQGGAGSGSENQFIGSVHSTKKVYTY